MNQIRASHILVDYEHEANDLLGKIKDGKTFEELAQKFSKCPSGDQGGDLGFFKKGMMVPEFEAAAFALNTGETSKPVKTQFGFHLIKRTE
ncbi:MAG: peptidylprolyl isomerase [Bdellovibrionota bacterium]